MLKLLLSCLIALACLSPASSQAANASETGEGFEKLTSMVKLGEGKLRYMFWNIYTAELYAADAAFSFDRAYALHITYARALSKQRLVQSTEQQLTRQALATEKKISSWVNELNSLWRDVKKNDQLTLWVDQDQVAHFYFNKLSLGSVSDPEFAKAFAGIWLAENTSKPDLRADLLNLTPAAS